MNIKHALAAFTAVFAVAGLSACEAVDEPGTAADRVETKDAAKKDAKPVGKKDKAKSDKAKKPPTPAVEEVVDEEPVVEPAAPVESAGQAQARGSAALYLDMTAFSRSGLIGQLEFEGYSTKDATYGVDAQKANWNDQAALSAKNYLDMTPFSRAGLIDQLMYEGYSQEQATYGVNQVGL